jgi:hypothetical protein
MLRQAWKMTSSESELFHQSARDEINGIKIPPIFRAENASSERGCWGVSPIDEN